MARARNLKPSLFRNEILGTADPLYTLLFQSLWLIADREGRLEDRPIRIKADTFPYRENINCDAMLQWLHDHGFIIRYDSRKNQNDSSNYASESRFIQIVNFTKHQNPHRNEAASIIPENTTICKDSSNYASDSSNYASASEEIGSAPALTLNPLTSTLNPLPSSKAASPKEEEQQSHIFQDSDTRRFFAMPMDWQPDLVELQKYVNGKSHAGKPLTVQAVMEHLTEYRESTHAKGESRTESQWCMYFVKWAQKCLASPKKPDAQPTKNDSAPEPYKPVSTPNPYAHMYGPRDPEVIAQQLASVRADKEKLLRGK